MEVSSMLNTLSGCCKTFAWSPKSSWRSENHFRIFVSVTAALDLLRYSAFFFDELGCLFMNSSNHLRPARLFLKGVSIWRASINFLTECNRQSLSIGNSIPLKSISHSDIFSSFWIPRIGIGPALLEVATSPSTLRLRVVRGTKYFLPACDSDIPFEQRQELL